MTVSDAAFDAWLEADTAQRVCLFELDHVYEAVSGTTHTPTTATVYLSDRGYVSGPGDTPASTAYVDAVRQIPEYARAIDQRSLGGRGTLSLGALLLDNPDGAFDALLDLACDGSELRCYLGDRTWSRADFRHVFTAMIERIDAPDTNTLQVALKDALGLLDAAIATEYIGGTGPNKERAKPVVLGYCHQVECLLEDPATLKYRYGVQGAVVDGSVRDSGLAVAYTDNGDGTFTLAASPAGLITCDVMTHGPNGTYVASDLIEALVKDYTPIADTDFQGCITPDIYPGPPSTAFGDGDFQLGVRVAEKSNTLDVLDQVCFSAIAFYTFTREAKFAYGRIWPFVAAMLEPVMTFTEDDIRGEITLDHADPTYYTWYFYYNKNWVVMTEGQLAGGATPEDVARFSAKGVYASNRPSRPGVEAVISPVYYDQPSPYHKTMAVSPETETLLSILDADEDADYPLGTRWFRRMRNIFFPWLEFVTITVGLRAYTLELGAVVALDLDRYGYAGGVNFQVLSIDLKLVDGAITLVLVRQRGADVLPPNVAAGVGSAAGSSSAAADGQMMAFQGAGLAAGSSSASADGELADGSGGGGGTPPTQPYSLNPTDVLTIEGENTARLSSLPRMHFLPGDDNALIAGAPELPGSGWPANGGVFSAEINPSAMVITSSPAPSGKQLSVSKITTMAVASLFGISQSPGNGISYGTVDSSLALSGTDDALFPSASDDVIGAYCNRDDFVYCVLFGTDTIEIYNTNGGAGNPGGWGGAVGFTTVTLPAGLTPRTAAWLADGTQLFINAVEDATGDCYLLQFDPDDLSSLSPTFTQTDSQLIMPNGGASEQDIRMSPDGLVMAFGCAGLPSSGGYGQGAVVILSRASTGSSFAAAATLRTDSATSGASGRFGCAISLSGPVAGAVTGVFGEPGANSNVGRVYGVPDVGALSNTTHKVTDVGYQFAHSYGALAAYGINVAISSDAQTVAIATTHAVDKVDIWRL